MTAPVSAAAQVARLLALVPYALTRREVPLDEAAADLGVTPKQIVNDLKVLMFCGWPGYLPGDYIEVDLDALEGEGVIRVTNADYLARPLRLTVPEASALIVALRTLRDSADPDVVSVVDRTLAKLEAAAEDGAAAAGQVDVHLGERERSQAQLRSHLAHAVAAGRQVNLTYYVPARDERTERVVDPLGLVTTQGMTYLDGWCHRAEDRRLFRLDRIEAWDVLDSPADPHPDVEPRDLSAGLFQPSGSHETAVDPPGSAGPMGGGVLPGHPGHRSRGRRPGRGAGDRGSALAPATAAPARARRRTRRTERAGRDRSRQPHGRRSACTTEQRRMANDQPTM